MCARRAAARAKKPAAQPEGPTKESAARGWAARRQGRAERAVSGPRPAGPTRHQAAAPAQPEPARHPDPPNLPAIQYLGGEAQHIGRHLDEPPRRCGADACRHDDQRHKGLVRQRAKQPAARPHEDPPGPEPRRRTGAVPRAPPPERHRSSTRPEAGGHRPPSGPGGRGTGPRPPRCRNRPRRSQDRCAGPAPGKRDRLAHAGVRTIQRRRPSPRRPPRGDALQ
jgi:hypothetical protein